MSNSVTSSLLTPISNSRRGFLPGSSQLRCFVDLFPVSWGADFLYETWQEAVLPGLDQTRGGFVHGIREVFEVSQILVRRFRDAPGAVDIEFQIGLRLYRRCERTRIAERLHVVHLGALRLQGGAEGLDDIQVMVAGSRGQFDVAGPLSLIWSRLVVNPSIGDWGAEWIRSIHRCWTRCSDPLLVSPLLLLELVVAMSSQSVMG